MIEGWRNFLQSTPAPHLCDSRRALEYTLDGDPGQIALFQSDGGLLSFVPPEFMAQLLEELERRLGQLSPGTRLRWTPLKWDALASRFCSLMINTMNLRSSVSIIKFDCSLLHANRRLFGHKPGSTPKLGKRPILLRFWFRASHRQAGIDNRERSDLRETCWFTNSVLPVQRRFHPGPDTFMA